MQWRGERQSHFVVQRVGVDEGVSEQVQVLQAQLLEVAGQHGQLVVCRRQEPELGEAADMEGQAVERVVVQLEVGQLPQLAELGREEPQAVLAEVQPLQGALQRGQAQRHAEGLQVVVVEDELRQAAQVADGGRQLLDVVVAQVQPAESCRNTKKDSTTSEEESRSAKLETHL